MKRLGVALLVTAQCWAQDWRVAAPGWEYKFPRDHHVHAEFKTEWWYFTGNLFDERGKRYGYELTFFRDGIIPPAERDAQVSRFLVSDLKFAHFAVTDATSGKFHFFDKANRGAFGEAGFDRGPEIVWIEDWKLRMNEDGTFQLDANSSDAGIQFSLEPQKAAIIHGENGVSAKASEPGHASHYYSISRLTTIGQLRLNGHAVAITGTSWFDHEWATNQLAANQSGWNWLCLQFSDDTELMLYQMRLKNGAIDPASSGTLIAADGKATHLNSTDFQMTSTANWRSPKSNATYPIEWRINACGLNLRIKAVLQNQELAFVPLTYWEGAVDAIDANEKRTAVGYLELTGYVGGLNALSR